MKKIEIKKILLEKLQKLEKIAYEINNFEYDEHPMNILEKKTMELYPFGKSFEEFTTDLNEYINEISEEIRIEEKQKHITYAKFKEYDSILEKTVKDMDQFKQDELIVRIGEWGYIKAEEYENLIPNERIRAEYQALSNKKEIDNSVELYFEIQNIKELSNKELNDLLEKQNQDSDCIIYYTTAEKDEIIKYYIEISNENGYIIQSNWFDTKEEAIEWFEKINYTENDLKISLMYSIWDKEEDTYTDIEFEELLESGETI